MKNYCIIGTGSRGIYTYGQALTEKYQDVARITGLCDNNSSRVKYAQKLLGKDIPVFTEFERMLQEVECDTVIVTSRDDTHHDYIIKALYAGKEVISEKPMTVDDEKCRQILNAEKATGKKVRITFNCRFMPYALRVKELLDAGIIGEIYSVDMKWQLDTVHGADYYRRWHRRKENSGGLLVHKSTHHFDLINWWIGQDPRQVFAYGSRRFYGDKGCLRSDRCVDCPHSNQCRFHLDIRVNPTLKELYYDYEKEDGYFRDRCVFDPEIDIEDTISVLVKYENGIQLNYSLVSYAPFEGWHASITGSKGRLEAYQFGSFVGKEAFDLTQRESARKAIDWRLAEGNGKDSEISMDEILVYPQFGGVQKYCFEKSAGDHGGGDDRMRDILFIPGAEDKYRALAGTHDGAMSVLIGVAANHSVAGNCPVSIDDLLRGTHR